MRELSACYRVANLLDLLRSVERYGTPEPATIRLLWTGLAGPVGPAALAALQGLWAAYRRHGAAELAGLGGPVVVSPRFGNGFGVGDVLFGDTLIDIKVSQSAEDHLERWLRQIVGYALSPHDLGRGIRAVGVYHAVEACLMSWSVERVVEELAGVPRSRAGLEAAFAAVIDEEGRELGRRRGGAPG